MAEGDKLTVEADGETAIPEIVWQAFYGKDITIMVKQGENVYTFNGLALKSNNFDPDVSHNLSDLATYLTPDPTPDAPVTGYSWTFMIVMIAFAVLSGMMMAVMKMKRAAR